MYFKLIAELRHISSSGYLVIKKHMIIVMIMMIVIDGDDANIGKAYTVLSFARRD
jgi:hypothetical protein